MSESSPTDGDHSESSSSRELEERMPPKAYNRNFRFSNRGNSGFKWQGEKSVIGALEVPSEPYMAVKGKYSENAIISKQEEFGECMRLWETLKLKKSLVEACESIPPATRCCGLINDQNKTVRDHACMLNKGWVKSVNKKLKQHGFKLDCFVWSWNNAHGKAVTSVLMIRFHSLSIRKFQAIARESVNSSTTASSGLAL